MYTYQARAAFVQFHAFGEADAYSDSDESDVYRHRAEEVGDV